MRGGSVFGLMALLLSAMAHPASAQDAVAQFYKGKQVKLYIASTPGGGYDSYGRLVAQHIGKYIPGNPTVVPVNMPGAGGNRLAAYLYSVATKDGTEFGIIFPGAIMTPLLDPERHLKFDPPKFQFLGTANKEVRVCAFDARIPVKTFADAMKNKLLTEISSTAPDSNFASAR